MVYFFDFVIAFCSSSLVEGKIPWITYSKYGVIHKTCVTTLVFFCSFSLSSFTIILGSDKHEMGITLFNFALTKESKVANELACAFPPLGICVIQNVSKVEISCFTSQRHIFIISSLTSNVSMTQFTISSESLQTNTFFLQMTLTVATLIGVLHILQHC